MKTAFCCLALAVSIAFALPRSANAQDGPYRFVKEIPIPGDTGFDYLNADPVAHRLFVSHGTKMVVVDTVHDKIEWEISDLMGVHGIAIARDLGRGFITDGGENVIAIVDLGTLKVLQRVKTGMDPDTVAYDPIGHNVIRLR
jgi:DNA-binding beta-propeller fold protein YncE